MQIRKRVQRGWPAWRRVRRWVQAAEDDASLERGQSRSRRGGRPPAEFAGRPADEHVLRARIQHPVVPFARVVVVARNLDETLVQREVVPDGVLPALLVVLVVRKMTHDVLVDAVQGQPLLRALPNGHHDERVVTVRRFLALFLVVRLPTSILRSFFLLGGIPRRRSSGRRRGRGRARRVVHRHRVPPRAVQRRRLVATVPGHVQILAGILAVVDVTDLGGGRSADARRWGAGARLRQDAADAEAALEGSSRRRRGCHRLLFARSFHIHHSFVDARVSLLFRKSASNTFPVFDEIFVRAKTRMRMRDKRERDRERETGKVSWLRKNTRFTVTTTIGLSHAQHSYNNPWKPRRKPLRSFLTW